VASVEASDLQSKQYNTLYEVVFCLGVQVFVWISEVWISINVAESG